MGFRAFGGRSTADQKGRARQAGRRQGAGHRAQGQGTDRRQGRVAQGPKTSKITFLQLWAKARAQGQGWAGRRAGAQAGCRAQGAGAGRFHFEVFKA